MNGLWLLVKRARRTALLCGLALGLSLTALSALVWIDQGLQRRTALTEQNRRALQAEQEALAGNLQAVREGRARFAQQQRQGLVAKAERERWVNSLLEAHAARQFSGPPEFTLKPAAVFALAGSAEGGAVDPALAVAGAAGAALPAPTPDTPATPGNPSKPGAGGELPVTVWMHELNFQLAQAHEQDVLDILAQLQATHAGLLQVQGCRLSDPRPEGLRAQCTLRFFNIARQTAPAPLATAGLGPALR